MNPMTRKTQTATLTALLLISASACWAAPEFEAQTEAAVAALAPADDSLWVTFDRADLANSKAKDFPLKGKPVMTNSSSAVFKVRPSQLPALSQFMHENFLRCGGFFASRTASAARATLKAASVRAAGAYTLDSQAVATPLVAMVGEAGMRATISSLAAFNNRYYTSDSGVEAAHWIQSQWQQLSAKIPGASVALVAHEGWSQPSVVLTIPGAVTPDEIVVLGGHLDSINGWSGEQARAPGADDNASGIAVLTETIRVLAAGGFRPKRTVQFMGYAAEEVGLRGSQDIAEQYAAAGKKVTAVIQYDMSNFKGSTDEIYLLTDNVDPSLSEFTGKLIDTYVGVPRSTTECGYGCSDHASWNKQGYPAAMAFEASFEGMNHKIHTDKDTLANSGGDARHSVSFAKLAVAFAVETAKSAKN
jgi:leucyl aminopeptidase